MSALDPCAECGQPAQQWCDDCVDAPTIDMQPSSQRTSYCSDQCREDHMKAHKVKCDVLKCRKRFFRATDLLKKMYFIQREAAFPSHVVDVSSTGSALTIKFEMHGRSARKHPDRRLYTFPRNLCSDDQQTQTVLAYMGCGESIAVMFKTAQWLLAGNALVARSHQANESQVLQMR